MKGGVTDVLWPPCHSALLSEEAKDETGLAWMWGFIRDFMGFHAYRTG